MGKKPRLIRKNVGKVESATVYTLLDDYSGYDPSFYGQHGLSFLIDVIAGSARKRILFDTGQSGKPILYNMGKMGLNPKHIDMVFLSHCHYDHTGGLIEMLRAIDETVTVIAHPSIFRRNLKEQNFRHVGVYDSKEEIEKYGAKWILDSHPRKLMDGVITTGEIPIGERVDFERETTSSLYTIVDGKLVQDDMLDDVSIAIKTGESLVVVSGCSHAGIVSIVKRSMQVTGSDRIKAVVGGYHLIDAKRERIEQTVKNLEDLRVEKIYTGHCTGIKAECSLLSEFGVNFEKLHSGKVMRF
jgi:7,8-dihydropterin-6-yl-methyl-4-(beta-D-ribofuranosyl)aminobenzene 5'-phosphate synthase